MDNSILSARSPNHFHAAALSLSAPRISMLSASFRASAYSTLRRLEHDPEKWAPVFRKRSCSNKKIEWDDDSKKSHPTLDAEPASTAKSKSALRTHQPLGIFSTQHVMMEVGDPLAAGNGQAQVFDPLVEVARNAVPEEFRIFVDEIGGGRISELPVHADLLEFIEQRVDLLGVHWIAKLA